MFRSARCDRYIRTGNRVPQERRETYAREYESDAKSSYVYIRFGALVSILKSEREWWRKGAHRVAVCGEYGFEVLIELLLLFRVERKKDERIRERVRGRLRPSPGSALAASRIATPRTSYPATKNKNTFPLPALTSAGYLQSTQDATDVPTTFSSDNFAALSISSSFASSRLLNRSYRSSLTFAVRRACTISARYVCRVGAAEERGQHVCGLKSQEMQMTGRNPPRFHRTRA